MRNQDPSKTSSRLARVLSIRQIRLQTNWARALMKMLPHPNSLNKRTLFALDLTTHYSNQHWACRIPYSTGRTRAFQSCVCAVQLFRRQCVWVKTLQAWHFSTGLKTLWVTHLLYGRLIAIHPSNLFLYFWLDSSHTQATQVNMKQKLWYLRVFLPRGTQLVFSSKREVVGPQDEYLS
jgi:hypothetical protein